MAGDGQVTLGQTVMKGNARKVKNYLRRQDTYRFAGATADAFTLFERFEGKVNEYNGDITRAAVELAKQWRTDRMLSKLEAMLLVADKDKILLISGTGDVIEPEEGVLAIGSGGNYAYAAGPGVHGSLKPFRQRNCIKIHGNRIQKFVFIPTAVSLWRKFHD